MRVPGATTVMVLIVLLAASAYIWLDEAAEPADPVASAAGPLMDRAQMLDEYRTLAENYPWPLPPGIGFPDALPEPAEVTVYETGEGRNQADSFWICAWIGEWLSQRATGSDRAETAWAWLQRADETQLHRENYDDPRDVWHKQILDPAGKGRVRSLREFHQTSCGHPELPAVEAPAR